MPAPLPKNGMTDWFKGQFKNGFSSPTKYAVWTLRPGEGGGQKEWFPESITLPSRSLQAYSDMTYGTVKQYPYKSQFNDEIVMTIPLSSNGTERAYFEGWMETVVGYGQQRANCSMINLETWSLWITVQNQGNSPAGKFAVYGAYPSGIIPSNYGYGMQNEVAKLQVTFNYWKYYYF